MSKIEYNVFKKMPSQDECEVIGGYAQISGIYTGPLRLVKVAQIYSDNAPDFIVQRPDYTVGGHWIWAASGSARKKTGKTGREYISLKLDINEKALTIWPSMFADQEKKEVWQLVFNRFFKSEAPTQTQQSVNDEIVF